MFKFKNTKGFTIIELIVVMAIIGILVLLAVPKFMNHTQEAKFTKFISNTKQIENASERYYMDKNDWPRLSDTPYSADQINAFSQKIYDATGKEVTLDPAGDYYDIDYSKLSQYVNIPDIKLDYIIQNPVGNVYALENITQEATVRLETGGVLLDKTTLTLNVGEVYTVVATIMPTTSINKNVTWTSSNSGVATIDSTGLIKAIGDGTATITVKTENGGYLETCVVTVIQPVTGISISPTTATVAPGSTTILTSNVIPITATNKSLTWISSNASIATVNSSGVVTGVTAGTVTITAKTVDGNYISTSTITVTQAVTSVSVNPTTANIFTGGIATLTATILPTTAANKTVTWTSSNTNIATVNSSGVITGVTAGTAIITVKTIDGNMTATSTITVNNAFVSQTFGYSGTYQSFVVPITGAYKLEVWGAQGGYNGGLGGYSVGNINLSSGQIIYIYVGGQGFTHPLDGGTNLPGGWNGGGGIIKTINCDGGTGGGATDIRIGGQAFIDRKIVGGGGGGGGAWAGPGGGGGGMSGQNGAGLWGTSNGYSYNGNGYGATQIAGGSPSTSSLAGGVSLATSGLFGVGGNGGNTLGGGSGGGGGGWYGGGGGSVDAGGGGSGYIGGVTGGTMSSGTNSGNGTAKITFVG